MRVPKRDVKTSVRATVIFRFILVVVSDMFPVIDAGVFLDLDSLRLFLFLGLSHMNLPFAANLLLTSGEILPEPVGRVKGKL